MGLRTHSAGSLNRQVTLKEAVLAQDGAGQPVHTYSTSTTITPATRYARIRELRGNELVQARSVNAVTSIEVTMQYTAGLTSVYRLLTDASETLEILDVIHDERLGATRCNCARVT